MTNPRDEKPVDLGDVPGEEGIDPADAAERLDEDPEAQPNLPEQKDAEQKDAEGR
jgi:hypothetical protein